MRKEILPSSTAGTSIVKRKQVYISPQLTGKSYEYLENEAVLYQKVETAKLGGTTSLTLVP